MGRHVAADRPDLERLVDEACAGVARAVAAAKIPRLAGIVLGGGYGRGEGGAKGEGLSNDLDFFAITEEGAGTADIAGIRAALEPVSEEWKGRLGIDVDFTIRTPWRIRHDERRIMVQELLRGYFDVAGKRGEELFAEVERRPAGEIPWGEAARLLMNRGMGLLFAREAGEGEFASRNINKCILGAFDARLVARHAYRWRALERAEASGDALCTKALEWKFNPQEGPVCGWERARETWLEAFGEVMPAGGGELARSLREAARWIVRRRTAGELASFGQNCTVRVLRRVERAIRERAPVAPSLLRDWEIFN